jgi:hypothetical protein
MCLEPPLLVCGGCNAPHKPRARNLLKWKTEHVSTAIQSGVHPDRRTPKQKLEPAKHKIRRLAEALNMAAWQD